MPYCDPVEFKLSLDIEGEPEAVRFKIAGSGDPFLTAELGEGLPSDSEPDDELSADIIAFANQDRSWKSAGACAGFDTDMFYPERGESTDEAKAVCQGCDIREQCLEFALANGENFGIWGGTSERQRREIRRQRAFGETLLSVG